MSLVVHPCLYGYAFRYLRALSWRPRHWLTTIVLIFRLEARFIKETRQLLKCSNDFCALWRRVISSSKLEYKSENPRDLRETSDLKWDQREPLVYLSPPWLFAACLWRCGLLHIFALLSSFPHITVVKTQPLRKMLVLLFSHCIANSHAQLLLFTSIFFSLAGLIFTTQIYSEYQLIL